jgi:hypothetical protein
MILGFIYPPLGLGLASCDFAINICDNFVPQISENESYLNFCNTYDIGRISRIFALLAAAKIMV